MHHHKQTQGLCKREKVLFIAKRYELLKTGKGSYALLPKKFIKMGRWPLHLFGKIACKADTTATLPPIAS